MASLIPETVKRLQATAFVNNAELAAIGRDRIISVAAEKLTRVALHKMLQDCIKVEGDYMGYTGQTLRLDVFVLSPEEIHQIIARAREEGERDALRWDMK